MCKFIDIRKRDIYKIIDTTEAFKINRINYLTDAHVKFPSYSKSC